MDTKESKKNPLWTGAAWGKSALGRVMPKEGGGGGGGKGGA